MDHPDINVSNFIGPFKGLRYQYGNQQYNTAQRAYNVLSCQPRVTVTSGFVYKVIRDF